MRLLRRLLLVELALSALLVLGLAWHSRVDAHPDEGLHIAAGLFYERHWLPPAVGDSAAAASLSAWGTSYLDEWDVVYLLFGKAAALGRLLRLDPTLSMRSVQCLLYLVLVLLLARRSRIFPPAAGFLLLTPQVWYVFSYVNGDALPFALAMALALELGWRESGFHPALVGLLLGLLAVCKLNYLVLCAFLLAYAAWLSRRDWRRLAIAGLVAAAVALPRVLCQEWANGWHRLQRRADYAEMTASPDKKPSLAARPGSFPFLAMKRKGIPLSDLVRRHHWLEISYRSFCGLYGWMTLPAPGTCYAGFALLHIGLLILLVRGGKPGLLAAGAALAAAVVAQSLYRSWTVDFQAQGRLLFPIIPALCLYWQRRRAEGPEIMAAAGLLGLLCAASFGLVALPRL